jgi:hypothetical protein
MDCKCVEPYPRIRTSSLGWNGVLYHGDERTVAIATERLHASPCDLLDEVLEVRPAPLRGAR